MCLRVAILTRIEQDAYEQRIWQRWPSVHGEWRRIGARASGFMLRIDGALCHGATPETERLRVHVALAQVMPNPHDAGDIAPSLARLREVARQAQALGVDVLVLPEYYLSGSSHDVWRLVHRHDPLGSTEEQPAWLAEIGAIARESAIAIVTGSAVLRVDDEAGSTLFNTAYFVDHTGAVLGSYTKRNLWHSERALLTRSTDESHPPDRHPSLFVFETRRGLRVRASMLLCWDLMVPEAFLRLLSPSGPPADLDEPDHWVGPDIVFAPTCWYADDSGPEALAVNAECEAACLDAVCVTRAMENECYVCMCNAAGASDGTPRGLGRSSVNAPLLGCSARLPDAGEALLVHTLDMAVVRTARQVFRLRHDRQNGIITA
ncbi:hypothetical protein MCAP1_001476 [Malassezia caprae]|uniref:CN hydrolase domain-containing protein n=1 Tax=Malassezia caprae TaxID=1381934 RepID=A0AAF0IW63_9BASI|nr:hypothetical protein MCAP1_001476 [Malassezia caprae]